MLVPLLRPVDEHGNGSTARARHPRGQPRHTAGMETHSRICPVPWDSENLDWEGARSNLLEKSWSKRSAWWHRTCWLGAPLRVNLTKPQKGEPDFTFSTAPCRAAAPLPGYQRSQQRAGPRAELPNGSCKPTATHCRWQRLFCRHPACSARGHPPLRSHPKPSGTTSHTSTHTEVWAGKQSPQHRSHQPGAGTNRRAQLQSSVRMGTHGWCPNPPPPPCLLFTPNRMQAAPHLGQRGHVALEGGQLGSRQRGWPAGLHPQRVVQRGLQVGHVHLGAGGTTRRPSALRSAPPQSHFGGSKRHGPSPLSAHGHVSSSHPSLCHPKMPRKGSDRSALLGCAARVSLGALAVTFSR